MRELAVPVGEDDLERLVLARSPRFQALLNKSRQSIQAGKGLPRDEFWKAVKQRHLEDDTVNREESRNGYAPGQSR